LKIVSLLLIFCINFLFAIDSLVAKYPFIKFDDNYIKYFSQPFFYNKCKQGKLKILQIGDSHLVSGDFSKGLLHTLEKKFCLCSAKLDYEDNVKLSIKKGKKLKFITKKVHKETNLIYKTDDTCGIYYYCIAKSGKTFEYFSKNINLRNIIKTYVPDLAIISLGTNDLVANYKQDELIKYISTLVVQLKDINCDVILVTPIEAIKKNQRMNNIDNILNAIRVVAEDYKLGLYDLYSISGGKNSRYIWLNNRLSRKDLIHFNPEGYYLQGILLANAIINSYGNN